MTYKVNKVQQNESLGVRYEPTGDIICMLGLKLCCIPWVGAAAVRAARGGVVGTDSTAAAEASAVSAVQAMVRFPRSPSSRATLCGERLPK